jgi:hypothetical protein
MQLLEVSRIFSGQQRNLGVPCFRARHSLGWNGLDLPGGDGKISTSLWSCIACSPCPYGA